MADESRLYPELGVAQDGQQDDFGLSAISDLGILPPTSQCSKRDLPCCNSFSLSVLPCGREASEQKQHGAMNDGSTSAPSTKQIFCSRSLTDAAFQSDTLTDHVIAGWQHSIDHITHLPCSWNRTRQSCIRSQHSAPVSKTVSFGTTVTLHAWDPAHSEQVTVLCRSAHEQFRTLWHMDGQACGAHVFFQVLLHWKSSEMCPAQWGPVCSHDALCLPCTTRARGRLRHQWLVDRALTLLPSHFRDWSLIHQGMLQWRNRRFVFVETWFLSDHLRVCHRARRLIVYPDWQEEDFIRQCALLWSDVILDMGPIRLCAVQPQPSQARSTVAHLLIIQSQDPVQIGRAHV